MQVAFMSGSDEGQGISIVRVKLQKNGRIPPHYHNDVHHTTVLSGTLYVGFGDEADPSDLVAIPAGAVYTAPAGIPHDFLPRDGDVVLQEIGVGPSLLYPVSTPTESD